MWFLCNNNKKFGGRMKQEKLYRQLADGAFKHTRGKRATPGSVEVLGEAAALDIESWHRIRGQNDLRGRQYDWQQRGHDPGSSVMRI
jgi:hypothetical protein